MDYKRTKDYKAMDYKEAILNCSEEGLRDIACLIVLSAVREYKKSPNKKNHNWFFSKWGRALIDLSRLNIDTGEIIEVIENGPVPRICKD